MAEFLAFEILALAFHLPFPLSIAASTRIANLVGVFQIDAARKAGIAAISAAFLIWKLQLHYTSHLPDQNSVFLHLQPRRC